MKYKVINHFYGGVGSYIQRGSILENLSEAEVKSYLALGLIEELKELKDEPETKMAATADNKQFKPKSNK